MNAPLLEPEKLPDAGSEPGEMDRLIRELDWSTTPLGPMSGWSPALRMMVTFLLANRFPLLLWWGPQFVSIYNDAYRPVLGAKHPWALGQPVSTCWQEIWHILRPLIETPYRGGPATWMEDIELELRRHGYPEETHFTIAYSPVPDESVPDGIGGVLATVHEITGNVIGERRVAILRDLGTRAMEAKNADEACANAAAALQPHAKDVPFALIYLLDGDRREARLAGAVGVEAGAELSPTLVDLTAEDGAWPFAAAMASEAIELVEQLGEKFPALPRGPWSDPPHTAVVAPIKSNLAHQLAGFLVVGISSRLRFDEKYRDFIELGASQVATAIANARAYEEERRRADALAEIDRAKTAFFSNVSHEFRTPLTLILGPLEDVLQKSPALPLAEAQEQLRVTHRNSLRLLKLVNTLLDFSRIEAGRLTARYEPVDLATFTAELAAVFRAAIEKAGLRFRVDCAPLATPAFVDRDMWEKIVFNLLSNALKFTLTGEIGLKVSERDDRFELSVSDTGVGIPEREMPNLFKRFHRIENARSRTHEGSGIGLAFVQELAKLHGGTVSATSRVGEGSVFTVTLPLGRAHLPPENLAKPAAPGSDAPPRQRPATSRGPTKPESFLAEALRWTPSIVNGSAAAAPLPASPADRGKFSAQPNAPRVVLADDNADMRDYMKRLLGVSYAVEAFPDGEAALASIRQQRPDLVLTDVMMPRLDGFGLLRAIREDPALRGLPVLLLSARAGDEASAEGLEAGADDYLIKPFTARELLSRVGAHVKMTRLREEMVKQKSQLQVSEARSDHLMHLMPMGVCILDPSGRVTFSNRHLPELLGRAPALGADWAAFARDFKVFLADGTRAPHGSTPLLRALREHRSFHNLDVEIERPDGSRVAAIVNIEPLFDDAGGFYGAILTIEDTTARRRAERDARFLAELTQALAALPQENEILAAAARTIGVHLRAKRCHFTEAAADGQTAMVREEWRADDTQPSMAGVQRCAAFGGAELAQALREAPLTVSDVVEHPLTREHRGAYEQVGMRAFATAPFVGDGRWIAQLVVSDPQPRAWRPDEVALLENAIARVWPMVERARAHATLSESEHRFRELAHISSVLIWVNNEQGCEFMNRAYLEFFGRPESELAGWGWSNFIHPEDRAPALAKYEAAFAAREPFVAELRALRHDGEWRWLLTRAAPRFGRDGQVISYLGSSTDITEVKRAAEELRHRTGYLELLNRAAKSLNSELELEKIVQSATDVGRELTGAEFGAFFYNLTDDRGESYTLYTLSGVPREAFAKFPMPRNTALFGPTFRGEGIVRIADVRQDPRFGKSAPHYGMPKGHLPVVSYLAVPVRSRNGSVLGGLFFGHAQPNMFTAEAETAVAALAAQAAIAIDNAGLYRALQRQLAHVREAEESARRLAAIVESSDDAIIAKNLDGTITSWNQGAQRIFGYTAGEIIGRSVLTLIPPERQAEEPVIIAKLRRGERLDHYETIRLHKDGRRLDVSLTVSPVRNEQGEIVGASKIARDITARKRAEAQQHALAEMIARVNRAAALPEIYDAALGAIQRCLQADRVSILLDEEGQGMRLVAWRGLSETYRAAAGVPAFWKPGEPNLESVIIEDVRKAELAPPWRALLESEGVRSLAFVPLTYERRLRGELILHYNQPRRFTASELEMAAALAAQIAFAVERQQGALALEALVADRTQSLRQAIGQMEEFSYSVSHDLRSPVRAMQGYAEAVLEDYGDRLDDHGRDMLARIGRAGRRMDQLIRDLLTYSRLSRREMMLEPVSLARLIPEVVQQYPEMHAERATIEIAPDLPAVLAHEPSLTQVVSNLLSNAVKFVAPGTRPHIRVTAGRHGDRVRVNFQDNGVGIPPEYQHRLFGMFERLHTERSYDGTGIGLAIVRKAVERMNGQVGMDSDGMQGSRFWIELNAPQPAIRPDARPPLAE